MPADCDPAYGVGTRGPTENLASVGPGIGATSNQSQPHQSSEGNVPHYGVQQSTGGGQPILSSLVDNFPGGAQIQRGGSLPNPVASFLPGNNQIGPGGRASSLSSSQTSHQPAAVATHSSNTSSAVLLWKMNERGPTGCATPAALASLAELLANPIAHVPSGQASNIATPSGSGEAGQKIPMQTLKRVQHSHKQETLSLKAKVNISPRF